jgi:hypothetical protein
MNGYELTARLRKTRRRYPLTAIEQALYHELVAICNEEEWQDTFVCSNEELCKALRVSENTLNQARNTLIQAGLIFYRSGKSKRQFGRYSFNADGTTISNAEVNTWVNPGGNPDTNPGTNAADYIEDKPKPNQTQNSDDKSSVAPEKNEGRPPSPEQSGAGEKRKKSSAQKKKKERCNEHWRAVVEVWCSFYLEHKHRKPTFDDIAGADLQRILYKLKQNATNQGFEWTQDQATGTLLKFLTLSWNDSWLQEHFLLHNLNRQFDKILTHDESPKSAAGSGFNSDHKRDIALRMANLTGQGQQYSA